MKIKGSTILFQGDSITDCGRARENIKANTGLGGGYAMLTGVSLLARLPERNLQIYNLGISGNRVVDLYSRWKIDALNLNPGLISILIGVNDTWHERGNKNGVEPERYKVVYDMLLDWTKKVLPEIRLVLCEPFVLVTGAVSEDWLPEIKERSEIVKDLARKYDAVFVPFQKAFDDAAKKAPADYWLGDGVHPTPAGHMLMTNVWLDTVLKS